jgi:hypothetical protein
MSKSVEMVFLDAITVGKVANLSDISSLGEYTGHEMTRPADC